MSISPIRTPKHPSSPLNRGPIRRPQGLASVPDRLEGREKSLQSLEAPPSLFKKFLFDPILQAILAIMRGVFTFVDFLRSCAFGEEGIAPPTDRRSFLNQLHSTPRPEFMLYQFEQAYSLEDQNRLYRSIGENYTKRTSWKEIIWERTQQQNIELGRRLVRQNPFLLREYLFRFVDSQP